jgi:hypothetical protein
MALTIARKSTLRGRPRFLGFGSKSRNKAHWSSVMSVVYGFLSIPTAYELTVLSYSLSDNVK